MSAAAADAALSTTAPASFSFDVVIIGAGLPGLALALALRGSGLTVALVDRRRPAVEAAAGIDCGDESDAWDSRIYGISPGNARFLDAIGVWPRMDVERISAIETMRIFGDRAGTQVDFSAFDSGTRALAWIVEQRELMSATLDAWADSGAEPLFSGAAPAALTHDGDRQRLALKDGTVLSARLVVGADGLQSWTRQQAGIAALPHAYGHTAVVANFTIGGRHHGRAWQWFQPDGGVMAWLPLNGQRMSIVWSVPDATAADLLALGDYAFAESVSAVGAAAAPGIGRLQLLTARASFPLSRFSLRTPIARRLALVGDAAHGIHPLAGQGLNLGYGDVRALAAVLNDRSPIGDPGDRLVLGRFARSRAFPNGAMSIVTDGLWRLFKTPAAAYARNGGMSVFNRLQWAKAILMQPAMR